MSDVTNRTRVPQGLSTGGQFDTEPRAESPVSLEQQQRSVDDFTPEQRDAIDAVHRHAYEWAHARVGNLGMETADYAEDYAAWVARRYMAVDCEDDSLGEHPRMVNEWDAERAANAAVTVATNDRQRHWVTSMASRSGLGATAFERGRAGQLVRTEFTEFRQALGSRGIAVKEQTNGFTGQRTWRITGLDGDRFGPYVRTGGGGA